MHQTFITLLVVFCLGASVQAQSVSGTISDPDGRPVSGVRLQLVRERGGSYFTLSDRRGRYAFENLRPAKYLLTIRELGFRRQELAVEVGESESVVRHLELELGEITEQVLVTATRTGTAASLLGNSVTVLTRDEIEASGALTVSDLFRVVPGLHVHGYGSPGSVTSLFVRGGETDYSKVLLDGIPLNQPGGQLDLSNLSTANVERIEIVRGPQSALYGSDAMTSVIQIFTRRGGEAARPLGEISVEGGSHSTFSGAASLRGGNGIFDYSTEFRHFGAENSAPNDFFRNNTFSTRLGIRTSERSSLTLLGRSERGRKGIPGPTAFGRPDLEEFYRKRDFFLGLTWEQQLSEVWQHRVTYSQSYVNQLSEDPVDSGPFFPEFEGRRAEFPVFDFPFSFLAATRRHLVNYQTDLLISSHQLSAGLDLEEQSGVLGETRAERSNVAYYLQDHFLLGGRTAVTAGVRFEHHGSFGFFAGPRLALTYLLRTGAPDGFWGMTRPRINFGLGIKEPTLIESYSPNFFFRGNPDLEPERSRSFEVGLEQYVAHERVRVDLSLFHNHFRDLIAFQTVDPQTFEGGFFNLGESRAWGAEAIVESQPTKEVRIRIGYTYLNTEVLKSVNPFDPVFREGESLLLRPPHSATASLLWTPGRWMVHASGTFLGARADSDFGMGLDLREIPGYSRWDLSGSYRLTDSLELYAHLNNLLNRTYFERLGYPALRFHFRSGLRVRF